MSEVLQTNIFFFITSVAVVLFTLLLCIAVYQIIRILRIVRGIIERIDAGSETIAEDLAAAREYFKEGTFFSHLMSVILGARGFGKEGKRAAKKRSAKKRAAGTKIKISDKD
jgi:hypothetical protein